MRAGGGRAGPGLGNPASERIRGEAVQHLVRVCNPQSGPRAWRPWFCSLLGVQSMGKLTVKQRFIPTTEASCGHSGGAVWAASTTEEAACSPCLGDRNKEEVCHSLCPHAVPSPLYLSALAYSATEHPLLNSCLLSGEGPVTSLP